MATSETNSARTDMWRRTARGMGAVAVIFSLVVGVLLTADWMRAGQAQTVRSDQLGALLARARQAPDSTTVALAREMDRVARHAYFSSVAFRDAGVWMLVSGLLIAVGCLHVAARLGRRIEDPRRFATTDQARADREARVAMLVAGAGGLAALAAWALGSMSSAPPPPAPLPAASTGAVTAAAPAAVLSAGSNAHAVAVFQWNGFRGPRCGVAPGSNAPVAWDGTSGTGVLWRVALAKTGISSPVLWGGTVFLTVADETNREVVAYSAVTGVERWRHGVADGGQGEAVPSTSPDTGLGAATPACDESGVYAVFGTGDLVAYSHDGKLLWQVYLRRPANSYGHASSLWVEGGKICVQYDQSENGRVLVIDAKSGKTIWEQPRTQGPSWSSPVVVAGAAGRPMLLVNGAGVLTAFDLADGNALWEVEGVSGEVAPSPAFWNGRIMVANASARMVCYELAAKPVQVWEYTEALPDVSSPVAADGLIFLALSSGQIACVDAKDGRELWKHDYSAGFYASPIVSGSRVYALDREGTMRIFAAERAFREIASCPLGDAADATPALVDGRIYIRTRGALWCLGAR
ncbi:MAG: PQQ-binding-like beta-propeller repeat protein [bacterium]